MLTVERASEYSEAKQVTVFAGTWNLNGKVCHTSLWVNASLLTTSASWRALASLAVPAW